MAGDYVLNLVVSNAHGTSQAATATVHAFSGNIPPNADAGANQYTTPNGTVTLSSAASLDPDGGPLTLAYLWWLDSLPGASTATLVHPLTSTPQFVADKSGYYIARVEATDGLASAFANTLVTSAVVCDADANGSVNATDITLIQAALGLTALPNDPRDFDHNGIINAADVTSCMNLIANPPPPVLQVSPPSFTVNTVQGSGVSTQVLGISSTGSALTFTIGSNQTWLTTSISSGSTASVSTLNAFVNPAGLSSGVYMGVLTFTPGTGTAQTVSVTLLITPVVAPPPPPVVTLSASPSALQFTLAGCTSPAPAQALSLTVTGASTISYTAQTSASWLTATPPSGSSGSTSATLTVSVNAAGASAPEPIREA